MQINRPEKEELPRLWFGDRQPVRSVRGNSYTQPSGAPCHMDDMQWRQSLNVNRTLFVNSFEEGELC